VHFLTGRENGWPVNRESACEASSILKGAPARPAMSRSMHSAAPSKRPGVEFTNGDQPGVRLGKSSGGSIPVEELNAANDD
jgi:hypothetical protein